MDIFPGWENHARRLENNWRRLVKEEDTVVIPGDVSWGLSLREALPDFRLLDGLPGKKIISKGNHDYWWTTAKKMKEFAEENGFKSVNFLYNNSFETEKFIICGTRGWIFEKGTEHDDKIIKREAMRLKASLDYLDSDKEKVVFLHYPAVYMGQQADGILELLKNYDVKRCFYAHLHGKTINYAFNGALCGTVHKLVSADSMDFCPLFID